MSLEKTSALKEHLNHASKARTNIMDMDHVAAMRLFSGFYEGCPELVVDIYAKTLVFFGYGKSPEETAVILNTAQESLLEHLPWVECVIQKKRTARDPALRRGTLTFGNAPSQRIREHSVWYAIDLLMNQDAGFYLDTRNLRKWLLENAADWNMLNTFAYTGSLGVAALAGGVKRVIQTDRNRKFLDLARRSAMLNHLDLGKMKLQTTDFFSQVAHFKRSGKLFDCVIVDPPFFSTTQKGTVDLVNESVRVINKVRPLIKNGGWLVTINNALFLSGEEYMCALNGLCQDGYLSIETLIPVPSDITGFPHTIVNSPPSDPAPFNHPTKIAVLRVKRK